MHFVTLAGDSNSNKSKLNLFVGSIFDGDEVFSYTFLHLHPPHSLPPHSSSSRVLHLRLVGTYVLHEHCADNNLIS